LCGEAANLTAHLLMQILSMGHFLNGKLLRSHNFALFFINIFQAKPLFCIRKKYIGTNWIALMVFRKLMKVANDLKKLRLFSPAESM
jgi:hypothetical protein